MAERERRTHRNTLAQFLYDVEDADRRAGKVRKDGLRPSERLLGAFVMTVLGIGVEPLIDTFVDKLVEKYRLDRTRIPSWTHEVGKDMVAAVAYAVARKQLGEQLPALRAVDLGITAILDVTAAGADAGVARVQASNNPAVVAVRNAVSGVLGRIHVQVNEPEHAASRTTDRINPINIGAGRVAGGAVGDWFEAYWDVIDGKPEPQSPGVDETLPTITKETSVIFVGGDCSDGVCAIPQAKATS